tara:strand:+ start:33 stop:239 length:207 start_codon:yes stop_codon:yes gene_type:complete
MSISKATRSKKSVSMKKAWAKKKASKKTSKKLTWHQFIKGKMSPYMKSEGSHKGAMGRLSKEWKAYNK